MSLLLAADSEWDQRGRVRLPTATLPGSVRWLHVVVVYARKTQYLLAGSAPSEM